MTKRNVGRPRSEFNQKLFEQACACFCNKATVCDILDCNKNTLTAWCYRTYGTDFTHIRERFRSNTKLSLRQMQIKVAMSGDTNMLKWLGKQELGQSESTTSDNTEIEDLMPISKMLEISTDELEKFNDKDEVFFNAEGVDPDA